MSLKNRRFKLKSRLDLRGTGGPLMPKGSTGVVEIVRRNKELWVNMDRFGHMHLYPTDVIVLSDTKDAYLELILKHK